jgi:hypothetical protein
MPWKMFLIERSPSSRRSLRRFFDSQGKPPKDPNHYHDAEVVIDPEFYCPEEEERSEIKGDFEDDPRWPKSCACGYTFLPEDHWQVNVTRLWSGSPDGELYPLRETPPGATWAADWFPPEGPNGRYTGPDGKVWCVMLPGGVEWIIYSHASGNPPSKWDVQGTVPNITVSPSISQVGVYHGFIKGGVISDDCEGRKFPKWPNPA